MRKGTPQELTQEEVDKLLQAVIAELMASPHSERCSISLPMEVALRLPRDFPWGRGEKVDGAEPTFRAFKCRRVLWWMNQRGYTTITRHDIEALKREAARMEAKTKANLEI